MQARILVVEDDPKLQEEIKSGLRKENFRVKSVLTGEAAHKSVDDGEFDVVVFDPLTSKSNRAVLKRLLKAAEESCTPVIRLDRNGVRENPPSVAEEDAQGFAACAEPSRLVAKVKEQLRKVERFRPAGLDGETRGGRSLVFGSVSVDVEARTVWRNGTETYLRPKEFNLLRFLLERPGQVFTRREIMHHVWGPNSPSAPKAVDVTMRSLREKVEENPSRPRYLVTERGKGYMFVG